MKTNADTDRALNRILKHLTVKRQKYGTCTFQPQKKMEYSQYIQRRLHVVEDAQRKCRQVVVVEIPVYRRVCASYGSDTSQTTR